MVNLQDYFEEIGEGPILFCPNPGNAGDSAIALGTFQLLDQVRRSCKVVRWDDDFDSTGKLLVYGGGGNLGSPKYEEARHFIEQHHLRADRMVILPHTVRGNEDLLHQIGENVDLFCRERVSYDWVQKHVASSNVHLADDMAFRIDVEELLDQYGRSKSELVGRIGNGVWLSLLERIPLREAKTTDFQINGRLGITALYQLMRCTVFQGRLLSAMRTDAERTSQNGTLGNVDVSRVFEYGVHPFSRAREATVCLLAYLDQFDRIVTNRLHIGILAALLQKEVDFYPNNYFKNKAVYEFSMQGRFPHVHWHGN